MQKNNKKILIISLSTLALLVIVFSSIFFIFKPSTQKGEKQFTLTVVVSSEDVRNYNLKSSEEYLGAALKDEGIISGVEYPQTGIFITTVDNITADENNREYWQLNKDNKPLEYGADSTVLNNGDNYEFVLSKY